VKQILQSLKTGATEVAEVPAPGVSRGSLLIHTSRTLISAGTERMLVDFGKANLLDKARKQPDKVKMVMEKVRTDGLMPTLQSVRNKLDQPLPLQSPNRHGHSGSAHREHLGEELLGEAEILPANGVGG
jgi:hypothetical protein